MLLQSMELRGFKSFPDPVKIVFDAGLTAVVGPNGSGKSNLSDALRWVMGEQSSKDLRGSKMEDVIFSGTKTRPAAGFAQVEISIENKDRTLPLACDVVTIRRRYDRIGESSYRINGKPVRLKDVRELLMDTGLGPDGYAMVGQGKISEIVHAKSDQRRELFEEAAGIAKYRYRQKEAMRKLDLALENLLRLQDIFGELEGRLAPLLSQAEKAKEFLSLAEEKKQVEISVWVYQLTRKNARIKDHKDQHLANKLEQQALDAASREQEVRLQEITQKREHCVLQLEADRKEREQMLEQIATRTADRSVAENDATHYEAQQQSIEKQLEQLKERQQADTEQQAVQQERIKQLKQDVAQLQQQVTQREQQQQEWVAAVGTLAQQQEKLAQKLARLQQQKSEIERLKLQCEHRIATAEEQREQLSAKQQHLQQTAETDRQRQQGLAQRVADLIAQQEALLDRTRGLQRKLAAKEQERTTLLQQQQTLSGQLQGLRQKKQALEALEANLEGFGFAVKTLIKQQQAGRLSGIIGTVAGLIQVSPEDTVAIETALGGRLQYVVVETEQHAKNAINLLKQQKAGRATLLPLTIIRGNRLDVSGCRSMAGFVGLAADLVRCEVCYDQIRTFLLGRIVVAEELGLAIQMAQATGHRFQIVTRDGQVIHAGGAMQGGSVQGGKQGGLLSRKRQIQTIQEQAVALEQQISGVATELSAASNDAQALRAQLEEAESERLTLLAQLTQAKAEQEHLTTVCRVHDTQCSELATAMVAAKQQQEQQHITLVSLQAQQEEIKQHMTQLQELLSRMAEQEGDSRKQREQMSHELQTLRLSEVAAKKDLEGATQRLLELRAHTTTRQQQQQSLRAEHQELAVRMQEVADQKRHHQESITALRERVDQLEQSIKTTMALRDQCEQEAMLLRREEKDRLMEREARSMQLARMEERLLTLQQDYDRILELLWAEYQLTRSEAQGLARPIASLQEEQARLQALREQIRSLGNVNVAAIEEYQELLERHQYLAHQIADVEASRKGLLTLIEELTDTMQQVFRRKFEQINQKFGEIFAILFGGGRGMLSLHDPSDLLGSGIEILVEPPGKVIKNLRLLSGGEQALVAIAIYFAILTVNPAPFCVLDEIEAALDDVNVVRYGEYLRLLSREQEQRTGTKMQFIAITHRRGTMEAADVLFGVTMQEEGVSKLLRLPVGELCTSG